MSKFRKLMETVLKEWEYDSNLDNGEWLDRGYVVRIVSGTIINDGNTNPEEPFNVDEYPNSKFYVGIVSDSNTYVADESLATKDKPWGGIYTVFDSQQIAEKAKADYQVLNPDVVLEIQEAYGYNDHWDTDMYTMINNYGEDHAYGAYESHLGDLAKEDW